MHIAEMTTNSILKKLCEREEVPQEKAIQHYLDNYQRTEEGRYSVSLPRLDPAPVLGESHPLALKHFISNERYLKRKNAVDHQSQEYEDLCHAEKVPPEDTLKPAPEHFYLPMHGVIKESSTTTKLCVVFNALATSSSGVSQ